LELPITYERPLKNERAVKLGQQRVQGSQGCAIGGTSQRAVHRQQLSAADAAAQRCELDTSNGERVTHAASEMFSH
jgi:hypothetical protein